MPAPAASLEPSISALRRMVVAFRSALPSQDAERLRSVILFGSRARGDHGPWSDWDLCAIWNGKPPAVDAPHMHDGKPIDWIHFPDDKFRTECGRVGTLPRVVALYGVPIIERSRIEAPKEAMPMNQKDWNRHFEIVNDAAETLFASVEASIRRGYFGEPRYKIFENSANLAERTVKLALDMQGVTPDATHNMHRLARQWPEQSRYRERTRELNGEVEFEHRIPYHDISDYGVRDTIRALKRANLTLALLKDVLEDPALGKRAVRHDKLCRYATAEVLRTAAINDGQWRDGVVEPLHRIAANEAAAPHFASMPENAARIGELAREITKEIEERQQP